MRVRGNEWACGHRQASKQASKQARMHRRRERQGARARSNCTRIPACFQDAR